MFTRTTIPNAISRLDEFDIRKTDYTSKKYVTEAKSLGVTCGVKKEIPELKEEKLVAAASGSGFFVSKAVKNCMSMQSDQINFIFFYF